MTSTYPTSHVDHNITEDSEVKCQGLDQNAPYFNGRGHAGVAWALLTSVEGRLEMEPALPGYDQAHTNFTNVS